MPRIPGGTSVPKILTQVGACGVGGYLGLKAGEKIGDKVAELEAVRQNLSPEQTVLVKRGFEIGMALALCAGGAAIAGTSYSKLSKRGLEARQKEVLAALDDAQPHTYVDPEAPALTGTAVGQPSLCRAMRNVALSRII